MRVDEVPLGSVFELQGRLFLPTVHYSKTLDSHVFPAGTGKHYEECRKCLNVVTWEVVAVVGYLVVKAPSSSSEAISRFGCLADFDPLTDMQPGKPVRREG